MFHPRVLVLAIMAAEAVASDPRPNGLFPNLDNLTALAQDFPHIVLDEINASPLRAVVQEMAAPETGGNSQIPTVTAHGMGDSCFNPGFKSITSGIGKKTGSYSVCIPTGDTQASDTNNGFVMSMDKSVDVFAAKIQKDKNLSGGFNAIGFSQGNSLIRGYIQKYNNPPVKNFISVHGTVMGVAAIPGCFTQGKSPGLICRVIAEALGEFAYSKFIQNRLFQAGYYRVPNKVKTQEYLDHSQLAQWNNENPATANHTFNDNFAKVQSFAMVKALKDTMVYPNDGEWWGAMEDGDYKKALSMNETRFYKEDLFGLKTADEAHKFSFETTSGGHLQFSDKEMYGWVEKYFMGGSESVNIIV